MDITLGTVKNGKELDNNVIKIALHKNLWDYDKEENRNIQWD